MYALATCQPPALHTLNTRTLPLLSRLSRKSFDEKNRSKQVETSACINIPGTGLVIVSSTVNQTRDKLVFPVTKITMFISSKLDDLLDRL